MREKMVIGNWKMNLDYVSSLNLLAEVLGILGDTEACKRIVICPPYLYLRCLWEKAEQRVGIGAQNCHHEEVGAYTGEVSARMIRSVGASYVIIGHSERRQLGENNFLIAKKMGMALKHGLKPILCVGEFANDRAENKHFDIVKEQLRIGLSKVLPAQRDAVIIAYEPVWAIGTGLTATPEQAQEMHAFIRQAVSMIYETDRTNFSILYGGSCNPKNAIALFEQRDIDGGLIGGASLNAHDFVAIVNAL